MNYYYITGTSRGIGRALAERLLEDEQNSVTGLARGSGPQHPRYTHHRIDLSDLSQVQKFAFPRANGAGRIVLVNNAGVIAVSPVGKLSPEAIVEGYTVNLIAPALLTNQFVATYRDAAAKKVIINIASGAGRNPTDGLSIMGASKAGLDMLSRVIAAEQKFEGRGDFRVIAVSPGVVDTAMAGVIVESSPEDSSRVATFRSMRAEGKLASPEEVAAGLCRMLDGIHAVEEVMVAVQDFPHA